MTLAHPSKNCSSWYLSILVSLLIFIPNILKAEQLQSFGDYRIHYNAFNSSMLTPEIAKQYEIQRSLIKGVINISVLDKTNKAVSALVEGQTKNPLSQQKILKFRKITESEAIYYIATFEFVDKEQLIFDLSVVPNGELKRAKVTFSQQFFKE